MTTQQTIQVFPSAVRTAYGHTYYRAPDGSYAQDVWSDFEPHTSLHRLNERSGPLVNLDTPCPETLDVLPIARHPRRRAGLFHRASSIITSH